MPTFFVVHSIEAASLKDAADLIREAGRTAALEGWCWETLRVAPKDYSELDVVEPVVVGHVEDDEDVPAPRLTVMGASS